MTRKGNRNFPAALVRMTLPSGRQFVTVSHGDYARPWGRATVEVLRAGRSCIRRGAFCGGCDRCDRGLIAGEGAAM